MWKKDLRAQDDWYGRFMSAQQNTLYISCVIMLAAEIVFGGTCPESARVEAPSRESMTYRVRDSKVRNGNSSTCLQHVWPPSKEVGKRTGNNRPKVRPSRKNWGSGLSPSSLPRTEIGAVFDNVHHGHLLPRLTYESGPLDHVASLSAAGSINANNQFS